MFTTRRDTNSTLHAKVFNTPLLGDNVDVFASANCKRFFAGVVGWERVGGDGVPGGTGPRHQNFCNVLVIVLLHGAWQSSGPSEHEHVSGKLVQTTESWSAEP